MAAPTFINPLLETDLSKYANRTDELLYELLYELQNTSFVTGPAGSNTQIQFNNNGVFGASSKVVFKSNNFGLNAVNPTTLLHAIKGSTGVVATFTSNANLSGNYSSILISAINSGSLDTDGSEIRSINTQNTPSFLNPRLAFCTQNTNTSDQANRTEKLTILGSGNVGINIVTPTSKLHVKGSGTTSSTVAFLIQNSASTTNFNVLDNGYVGIKTASPTSPLQISGLQVFADNTAALSGGLTAGALYIRSGHGLDIVN